MVRHRVPRPMTAVNAAKQADRSDMRDYDKSTMRNPGKRPSLDFDWDAVIPRIDKMLEDRNKDA